MANELPLICNYDIFVSWRKNLILSSLANKPQAIVLIADAVACLTNAYEKAVSVCIHYRMSRDDIVSSLFFWSSLLSFFLKYSTHGTPWTREQLFTVSQKLQQQLQHTFFSSWNFIIIIIKIAVLYNGLNRDTFDAKKFRLRNQKMCSRAQALRIWFEKVIITLKIRQ